MRLWSGGEENRGIPENDMQPVRAFVGHSFTPEDEAVVREFTTFLDTLRDGLPSFSWDHAVRPEPSLVDEKVLEILRDKNVFIGICTKKELVVPHSAVSQPFLRRDHWQAKKDSFHWKTSDWIIQEIGLAIGRGMKVILLIEDGVKEPGSLQGNLEHISFSRESPEKAFGKLTGMLSAVSGTARAQTVRDPVAEQPAISSDTPAQAVAPPYTTQHYESPEPSWTQEDYERALFMAMGDADRVRSIEVAYRQSALSEQSNNRTHFAAWKEYVGIVLEESGDLSKLKETAAAASHEQVSEINYFLGSAYSHLQEFAQAARTFETAAMSAMSKRDAAKYWAAAANSWSKAGEPSNSDRVLERLRLLAERDDAASSAFLQAVAELAKATGSDDEYFAAMEAAIHARPDDSDLRFSLAFRYSEVGRNNLALLHYSRITDRARSGAAWNNLGFTLEKLNVGSSSIAAYKKARELGETLAMSNMASRLLDVGFIDEALAILNGAADSPDHHLNVERQLIRAKEMPEEDESRESELLKKAQPESEFYRAMGAALKLKRPESLDGTWKAPRCVLQATVTGTSFRAYGTFQQSLGLIAAAAFGPDAPRFEERFFEYVGTVRSGTISGSVRSGKVGEVPLSSLLSKEEPPPKFLAYVDGDKTLQVLERPSSSSTPRFYTMQKDA